MASYSIQPGFAAGEISPSLFGRVDLAKYKLGASTLRNMFVSYRGGVSSRAGLAYAGMCKQGAPNPGGTSTNFPPRDIPFQFSLAQGYVLEFGERYMRVKSSGAYVIEAQKNVVSITNANPGVIDIAAHGYSNGDWVFAQNIGGTTEFNGLTWIVQNVTTNTFTLTDLFGNIVSTTTFPAFTSGGTFARIFTLATPYNAVDLPFLKFTQSADTMTLCLVNQVTLVEYQSNELVRNGPTNWSLIPDTFASSVAAPTGVAVTAQSSTTPDTFYGYVVTAISQSTGEQSVASASVSVENNDIAVNAGSNTVTWNAVTGANAYNVFGAIPSYSVNVPIGVSYGYLGTSFGGSFTDTNITADFTTVPPIHNNPFARGSVINVTITSGGSGFTQSTVSYVITTATGTGFAGSPIVVNGAVVGFFIENGGEKYLTGDTIAISGGGSAKATGSYNFNNGNPLNGQNIVLNGSTWTFVTTGATGNQTNIQGSLAATLLQLATDLTNSVDVGISVATYAISGAFLEITYGTAGTVGNSYTLAPGTYTGGIISGGTLTGGSDAGGGGATATLVIGPQTGTYPAVPSYYQQRRVYGYTLNNPNTYYMSQPGAYSNMDSGIPTIDSDAIVGTPWAQQINGIQFMQPMPGGLVVLSGSGAWQVNGGTSSAITPADQAANPQSYNGCHFHIPPIVANYDILYVQAKGSIVRDLSYNFFVNIYTGTDLTILSNHLFTGHQLVQWAYAEEPYKLVWVVRDDGVMLSMTYLKEQDIYAWARHDTNGLFQNVCVVTEPPDATSNVYTDSVYVITKRLVRGKYVYYSERMNDRLWANAEDCFCVDSGLSYPMNFPGTTLTPAAASGTSNLTSVVIINGGENFTNPTAIAEDTTGTGAGATFSVTVSGGVIAAITPISTGTKYTPGATKIIISDPTGSGCVAQAVITNYVTFTTDVDTFNAGMIGDVIRIGGGKATIVTFNSATSVIADITQPITSIIPNDPNNTPIPAEANNSTGSSSNWSISTPTSSISGLNHLEGMTVSILADGSVIPNQVVQNGIITLPQAYSQITVGLPYTCQVQTMYSDIQGGHQETSQGRRKSVPAVVLRVQDSRGWSAGANQPDASVQPNMATVPWTEMTEVKQRNATIHAGSAVPLSTGDFYQEIFGDWNEKGQIAVQQTYPLPLNLLAVISMSEIGDDAGAPG